MPAATFATRRATHTLFQKTQLRCLLGNDLFQITRLPSQIRGVTLHRRPRRVARQAFLHSLEKFIAPTVIEAQSNALRAAHFSNAACRPVAFLRRPKCSFSSLDLSRTVPLLWVSERGENSTIG